MSQIIVKRLPYFDLSISVCMEIPTYSRINLGLEYVYRLYYHIYRLNLSRNIRLFFVIREYTVQMRPLWNLNGLFLY